MLTAFLRGSLVSRIAIIVIIVVVIIFRWGLPMLPRLVSRTPSASAFQVPGNKDTHYHTHLVWILKANLWYLYTRQTKNLFYELPRFLVVEKFLKSMTPASLIETTQTKFQCLKVIFVVLKKILTGNTYYFILLSYRYFFKSIFLDLLYPFLKTTLR